MGSNDHAALHDHVWCQKLWRASKQAQGFSQRAVFQSWEIEHGPENGNRACSVCGHDTPALGHMALTTH